MITENIHYRNLRHIVVATLPVALMSWQPVCLAGGDVSIDTVSDMPQARTNTSIDMRSSRVVYQREFFARFSPATAYDILQQIPSFTPREASSDRGLGQASENVLINSRRASDKSGGAIERLRQISASQVQRVEVVDAAELNIPGLTGQVANFVIEIREGRGRYEWSPEIYEKYADNNLLKGSVSYTGTRNNLNYTLSLFNNSIYTGFGGGHYTVTDSLGNILESRSMSYKYGSDAPSLRGDFEYGHVSGAVSNFLIERRQIYGSFEQYEVRTPADGTGSKRQVAQDLRPVSNGFQMNHERSAFSGQLKVILVNNSTDQPIEMEELIQPKNDTSPIGTRFLRYASTRERIIRSEYAKSVGNTSLTASVERAYNKLNQTGELYLLSPDGTFLPVDYPAGTGGVQEVRHEVMIGARRPLGERLTGQLSLGVEHSDLERALGDTPTSRFFRPKGSLSLAWNYGEGRSLTGTVSRRVGQISFFDYLSQPNFREERERAGNPDLVPPQSWDIDLEYSFPIHSAVSLRGRFFYKKIEDLIDIIPIGHLGSGVGNIPSAKQWGGDVMATMDLSKFGVSGGRLDARYGFGRSSVRDPVTDETRPIGGSVSRNAHLAFRQDFRNQWAWGFSASYTRTKPMWYPNQIIHAYEGPEVVNVFGERKNLGSLTIRVALLNVTRGNRYFNRLAYSGSRRYTEIVREERQRANFDMGLGFSIIGNF